MRLRVFTMMVGVAALLAGCGGDPPTAELNAAKQILDEARTAGAEKYAPSEFATAQNAYSQAEQEVNAQAEKLFKNFDRAEQLIATAKSSAEAARSATMAAKQRAKSSAETAIASAAAALDAARASLAAAPTGKGTEGDIEALRADLSGAEADLAAARQASGREEYDTASSKAASAQQKAEQVDSGVQMATDRYNELVEQAKPWYERN